MNVLVTGCKGQLGNELYKIITEKKSELGEIPQCFHDCKLTCIDVEDLDITDLEAVRAYVKTLKPDVVINCAAYTNVNGCESDRDAAFRVNALGPRNLAVACEETGAKLVHVSTDYVFPGDGTEPYVEWDLCGPQSVYGRTKYLGEQYVRDFCSRYFIVRTAWLYGYVGNNFVKTMRRLGTEKGAVKVVSDQVGTPTNAADLAHHLLKLAATCEYGVYHCTGNGSACSWYEFTKKIIEYSGISAAVTPCTTEEYPTPAKRPAYSVLDNCMLRVTVGDEMRDWQEALKCYIEKIDEK